MPRRLKDGLDYFPLDVRFFADPKIRRLSVEFGPDGPLVYLMLLTMTYSSNGYYIEGSLDRLAYSIYYEIRFKENDKDVSYVRRILDLFVKLDLIDSSMLSNEIITSKGIQKQFLASTQRRKQKDHLYWILTTDDESSVIKNYGSDNKSEKSLNGINVDNNSVQEELSQTKKELMSTETELMSTKIPKVKGKVKVKGKEDKKDKYDITAFPRYLSYYTRCLISDHIIDIYDIDIERFNDLFDSACKVYDWKLVQKCFRYTRDYVGKNKEKIWNIYDFFRCAFENNLSHMEGYDERMERWNESMQELLNGLRKNGKER